MHLQGDKNPLPQAAYKVENEYEPLIVEQPILEANFPRSVYYIIGNEFCERFSYFGMKSVLAVYLIDWLSLTQANATIFIHAFNLVSYCFSLLGGFLADSVFGKYETIVYLSIIYLIGSLFLTFSSVPVDACKWDGCLLTSMLSLLLLAIGTGGIKPCVSSFGGDQFAPEALAQISNFFSIFYFTVNAGSMLSMLVTPLLRAKLRCFGVDSCFPAAFGVPCATMGIAILIFVCGSHSYKKSGLNGNLSRQLIKVYIIGIREWYRAPRSGTFWSRIRAHSTEPIVDDLIALHRLFRVLIFTPIFWALYDQQASNWVFQAMKMKTMLLGGLINMAPEQMQLLNAFLILVLIPIFDKILYPAIRRFGYRFNELDRLLCGMAFAVASYVAAGILQFSINSALATKQSIHILWQTPQFFLISVAEIMFSITGLEFVYSQAPSSMKSLCQSFWLLSVAAGNFVVIVLAKLSPIRYFLGEENDAAAWNYFFYASLLAFATLGTRKLASQYHVQMEQTATVVC